jgi:phage protein D
LPVSDLQGKGSRLRAPFLSVFVNKNDILTGVESVEVTNASHFAADTFRLTAAVGRLPSHLGVDYWSDSIGDELEIFAGFKDQSGGGQPLSLIYAQVDEVEHDPVSRVLTLTGRDLSARFLDNKTAEYFQQKTASDIIQILAARHGMQASFTRTTQKVGTYYELCNVRLSKDMSEWDLLMLLAQHEDFDLWVSKETLNFQPPVPDNSDPYVLEWSDQGEGNKVANFIDLKMQRSQTLAKDIIVKVQSWNQAQETTVVAEAKRNQANKSQRSGGAAQIFTFHPPNLNKDQADKFAASRLEDITKHERIVTGKLPGDSLLTHRSLIKLVGTGTSWDQTYNVDTVTRRLSFTEGYDMEFRAKNHSPQSTV